MGQLNIIGSVVIKLRFERGWSQETLAAKLQCQADDISRDVLANIETGRTQVTEGVQSSSHPAFSKIHPGMGRDICQP
jgi:transcriptional regulator with XRE-family HTH domain